MNILIACEESQRVCIAFRDKVRSKTFPGIAKAMAEQWGGVNDENKKG